MKNKGLAQLGHILNPVERKATTINHKKQMYWKWTNGAFVATDPRYIRTRKYVAGFYACDIKRLKGLI